VTRVRYRGESRDIAFGMYAFLRSNRRNILGKLWKIK